MLRRQRQRARVRLPVYLEELPFLLDSSHWVSRRVQLHGIRRHLWFFRGVIDKVVKVSRAKEGLNAIPASLCYKRIIIALLHNRVDSTIRMAHMLQYD